MILDYEIILRKQKSIKRELLNQECNFIEKKIAILGGSTTNEVKNILEIFLLNSGIKPIFYESDYNKYYEESVFENIALKTFNPDIIIIFTTIANIDLLSYLQNNKENFDENIEREYQKFISIWQSLKNNYNAVIVQNNFEMPYYIQFGSADCYIEGSLRRVVDKLNAKFAEYALNNKNFYIHDICYLSAKIGLNNWFNRSQYYAYKMAVNYDVIPQVSHSLSKLINAILGRNKKCLVVDLDNTLWGGIIGDDGINNIKLGNDTSIGEAYSEFQRYLLELKNRGIMLAVCSKNDDTVAKQGFNHPDMLLKVDDFLVFKANWEPKDINIQKIAKELNIGLDSVVFIDDNPVERDLVKKSLPEVSVPEVDNKNVFSYIQAIEQNGYFDIVNISDDDRNRNKAYQENMKRKSLETNLKSYDDFLKSLEMIAEINSFQEIYFDRITQLINKTNQFNLTTKRITISDTIEFATNNNYITLYGKLSDKFGDNGLISCLVGSVKKQELHIDLWVMSCRVLKRDVEKAMLDTLVEQSDSRGIKKIFGYYDRTMKNNMVSTLYQDLGFVKVSGDESSSIWELSIKDYQKQNRYIQVTK